MFLCSPTKRCIQLSFLSHEHISDIFLKLFRWFGGGDFSCKHRVTTFSVKSRDDGMFAIWWFGDDADFGVGHLFFFFFKLLQHQINLLNLNFILFAFAWVSFQSMCRTSSLSFIRHFSSFCFLRIKENLFCCCYDVLTKILILMVVQSSLNFFFFWIFFLM